MKKRAMMDLENIVGRDYMAVKNAKKKPTIYQCHAANAKKKPTYKFYFLKKQYQRAKKTACRATLATAAGDG